MIQQLSTEDMLRRIRGEYREMPGLRLTTAQAQRLWSLDCASCQSVLRRLVQEHFLWRTSDGTFVRYDGDSPAQSHSAEVAADALA